MLASGAGAATGSASAAGSLSADSAAAGGGSSAWTSPRCRSKEDARGSPLSTAAAWAGVVGVVGVTTRLGVRAAEREMGVPGVDTALRGARAFERQMRAAVWAGAMPMPDVKGALSSAPSSSQSSASRSSTRRAYDVGHSSSSAPGFLAGLAVVAGGVESESDGDASNLAACIEACGPSAPFMVSSAVTGVSVTAMYSSDPGLGHTCSEYSGAFVCCHLGNPLNLLERCDTGGDPDGLANMGGCECGDEHGPAPIRAPPIPCALSLCCGARPCAKLFLLISEPST